MFSCAGNSSPDQGDDVNGSQSVDETQPILGALDSSEINDVVRADISMVKGCYNEGLAIDPELSGRVEIKMVIGSSGAVTKGEVNESTLDSIDVEDCILDVMTGLQFPEPEGGGIVIVTYPFVLAP